MTCPVKRFFFAKAMRRTDIGMWYTPEGPITLETKAAHPPDAMPRFSHVAGLVVDLVGEGEHTISYEFEEPDSNVTPLFEARKSDWQAWMAGPNRAAVMNNLRDPEDPKFSPSKQELRDFQAGVMGVELRFLTPGEHKIHIIIDGQRVESTAIDVNYRTP